MLFDILLLSVIVMTAYLGPMVLRRLGPGQRLYGLMLVGDLGLALAAFAARSREGGSTAGDLAATIAIGGGVCLVLVPPILRDLARRLVAIDRLRLARVLMDLRELLQPGMGARQERELIDTIAAVRSGRVDDAVTYLDARRGASDQPIVRRHFDERIVLTYLYARRWEDAIRRFETGFATTSGAISPQLLVEMVRAYCEEGELDEAAGLVGRLEALPLGDEPPWLQLLSRARLVFLAFVGRTGAVEALVAPRGPLGAMPEAARRFWSGVARIHAGDRVGAESSLGDAARLAGRDGRARELAESTLRTLAQPGVLGPRELSAGVAELADKLTVLAQSAEAPRRPEVPQLEGLALKKIPVTLGLIVANLIAAGLIALLLGPSTELGVLVRAGANWKVATLAGELWRLPSSLFVHVGLLHLFLNMYGLWVIGRLVEQMLGPTRTFVVYVVAGLVGATASVLIGGAATSAGASGAVFGLLGAAVAELALYRDAYPRRWRRALLGNLLFLAVANVAIGFAYAIIDQSAHLGGMVSGALIGAALSRRARWAEHGAVRVAVIGLVVACAGALGYGAVGTATTRFAGTMARFGAVHHEVGGLAVDAPESWWQVSPTELHDPSLWLWLELERGPGDALEPVLAARAEAELARGIQALHARRGGHQPALSIELPAPWQGLELWAVEEDESGDQHFRAIVFGRRVGDELWLGTLYLPAGLEAGMAPTLRAVLESIAPAP